MFENEFEKSINKADQDYQLSSLIFMKHHWIISVISFIDSQGFPFENFGGGDKIPPHLGKAVGEGNMRRFPVGGKHNFTNLMGKNT